MSTLVVSHVVTGLAGIASGLIAVIGIHLNRQLAVWNALFLLTTMAACATGFVFLPTDGITSAQLVAFFLTGLLVVAAYARYVKHLAGSWNPVYGFMAVGALFLNVLITTAQSFVHIQVLKAWAPTQESPLFVVVKIALLLMFIVIALLTARRARALQNAD